MTTHPIDTLQRLARLALSPQEKESLGADLERVFAWISQLESVNVNDCAETPLVPMELREDHIQMPNSVNDVMSNAPARFDSFFLVPKVLDL
jgi:aspartyl/glutamyl-tRNA(Asn/Gln) amidotransferase C subunit